MVKRLNNMHKKWWLAVGVLIVGALGSWLFAATRPVSFWTSSQTVASTTITGATSTETVSTAIVPTHGEQKQPRDVGGIIANLAHASQFEALFVGSGVAASIKENGQYTIFVPTDAAFAKLSNVSKMTAAQRMRLIEYHIVAGRAINVQSEISGSVRALSGDPLNFTLVDNVPMVGSAIIVSSYKGTNGIVYVIDTVLVPPKK